MSSDERPPFTIIDGEAEDRVTEAEAKSEGANDDGLRLKIQQLEEEHRDLDQAISTMEERMPYDRLAIGRMKKRKLVLKDEIEELRDRLFPDIIA